MSFEKGFYQQSRSPEGKKLLESDTFRPDLEEEFVVGLYSSEKRGTKGEFTVRMKEGFPPKVNVFRDAFELFDHMSDFFEALSEEKPRNAEEIRSLLEDLDYKDFTKAKGE